FLRVMGAGVLIGWCSIAVAEAGSGVSPTAAGASTAPAEPAKAVKPTPAKHLERWRDNAELRPIENIQGIILIDARVSAAGRDTTGVFALDTGAGFVALDAQLARIIGISSTVSASTAIGTAEKPIDRLQIGHMQFDQVQPVLT